MDRLPVPQFAIFAQGTRADHFLEFDLRPGVTPIAAVTAFRRLRAPEVSSGGVNLVLAFGSRLWRTVAPEMAPLSFAPFRQITGLNGRCALKPSTTPGCGSTAANRTSPGSMQEARRRPWAPSRW